MPRKKQTETPNVYWRVRIDKSVADEVDRIFWDPITDKPTFGARGKLTSKLLREYLRKRSLGMVSDAELATFVQDAKLHDVPKEEVLSVFLDYLANSGYPRSVSLFKELFQDKKV